MILEGNQRGGAKNLALHLTKDENDHVEVHEIRGFVARDLMGAFNEAYAISSGTKCKQFLYSLSLNPPAHADVSTEAFMAAIEQVEQTLDLSDQPRAIVFHEKEGRRHAHVVWSRIDAAEMRAIPMSHDRTKLQEVSRNLYQEHGWKMPRGFVKRSERDPRNFTLKDWQQAKRVGKDPREISQAITDAWAISDSRISFAHALEERGYVLARGDRRGYVAVDLFGEVYAIPKKTGQKTKAVRDRLGDPQELPSVDEAKHMIAARMLETLERFREDQDKAIAEEETQFHAERQALIHRHRKQRQKYLEIQRTRREQEARNRQARFRKGLKGLWDRLRGEHKRIREQNEREAQTALERDSQEKDHLIQAQLSERRSLVADRRRHSASWQKERSELSREFDIYRAMQNAEPEPQRRARRRKSRGPSP